MQCLFINSCNVVDEKKGMNTPILIYLEQFITIYQKKTCLEFFLHLNTSIK